MRCRPVLPAFLAILVAVVGATGVASAREASFCETAAASTCGVGDLPRVTEKDWDETTIGRFVERAATGTVAVAVGDPDDKVRLISSCRLPGRYTEVATTPGSGRLWATNRVLLLPHEVETSCVDATHEIVAFARGPDAKPSAAPGTKRAFSAILVPIPCPSISDSSPARRCLGQGATGGSRLDTALTMMKVMGRRDWKPSLSYVLKVYALAPDHHDALSYLQGGESECTFNRHANWIKQHYRLTEVSPRKWTMVLLPPTGPESSGLTEPILHVEWSKLSCEFQPVFRKCFPGIAEPIPGWTGCWEAAAPPTPARPPAPPCATPAAPPAPPRKP